MTKEQSLSILFQSIHQEPIEQQYVYSLLNIMNRLVDSFYSSSFFSEMLVMIYHHILPQWNQSIDTYHSLLYYCILFQSSLKDQPKQDSSSLDIQSNYAQPLSSSHSFLTDYRQPVRYKCLSFSSLLSIPHQESKGENHFYNDLYTFIQSIFQKESMSTPQGIKRPLENPIDTMKKKFFEDESNKLLNKMNQFLDLFDVGDSQDLSLSSTLISQSFSKESEYQFGVGLQHDDCCYVCQRKLYSKVQTFQSLNYNKVVYMPLIVGSYSDEQLYLNQGFYHKGNTAVWTEEEEQWKQANLQSSYYHFLSNKKYYIYTCGHYLHYECCKDTYLNQSSHYYECAICKKHVVGFVPVLTFYPSIKEFIHLSSYSPSLSSVIQEYDDLLAASKNPISAEIVYSSQTLSIV